MAYGKSVALWGWSVSQKVVIIGAGIGGIATANILAKAGYEVHVYEKSKMPGGRAGLLEVDGFRFDTGPSWYLMPNVFEQYYRLLGKDIHQELDLVRLEPAYKVFFEQHEPLVITSDINQDAATFEAIEPGAGKALRRYVSRSKQIYDLSVQHFLYSNFTRQRNLLHPQVVRHGWAMLRHTVRPIDSYVSGYVRDQRLKQVLEYPMVFLGTSPYQAPSLYSLMSALDFDEGVFYPKGGIYTIITSLTKLSEELGVQYHYCQAVRRILTEAGRASGIELADGSVIDADMVVSNADLHHAETKLLEAQQQTYPEQYWRKKQASPSALLIYLGIKGALPEFEHHNLLFVDDWKTNFADIYEHGTMPDPASMYICKPSHTDDSVAPEGHENVFVLVPLPAGVAVDDAQRDTLAQRYIQQIEHMTGVDIAKRIVYQKNFGPQDFHDTYYSWQNSMLGPSHVLSQSAFFRTPNVSRKLDNLYYTGAGTVPGIGLPMCLIGAELVYKRLTGDSSAQRLETIDKIQESEQ